VNKEFFKINTGLSWKKTAGRIIRGDIYLSNKKKRVTAYETATLSIAGGVEDIRIRDRRRTG